MNLVIKTEQYDNNFVFFCDPIKNNVINDGKFIRIIYSSPNLTLNGIYLSVTFNNIICEKYFSKYRCFFNTVIHKNIIDNLKNIEENILNKYNFINKIPQYKIFEQINNGNLKIFTDIGNKSTCSFILKISGIWETNNNYGLTYKFIKVF